MNMRCTGRLVEWNDSRGFGFVQPDAGGARVFVHISAWQPRPGPQQRPRLGMPLAFTLGMEQGRPRALAVAWRSQDLAAHGSVQGSAQATSSTPSSNAGRPRASRRSSSTARTAGSASTSRGAYGALLVLALVWAAIAWQWGVPHWVGGVYVGLSLWSFAMYAYDKRQAQTGGWRTPESSLHTVAVLGGWPGALLAQQWLRHKSSKVPFRRVFWATVVLNMLAFIVLLSPAGLRVL